MTSSQPWIRLDKRAGSHLLNLRQSIVNACQWGNCFIVLCTILSLSFSKTVAITEPVYITLYEIPFVSFLIWLGRRVITKDFLMSFSSIGSGYWPLWGCDRLWFWTAEELEVTLLTQMEFACKYESINLVVLFLRVPIIFVLTGF